MRYVSAPGALYLPCPTLDLFTSHILLSRSLLELSPLPPAHIFGTLFSLPSELCSLLLIVPACISVLSHMLSFPSPQAPPIPTMITTCSNDCRSVLATHLSAGFPLLLAWGRTARVIVLFYAAWNYIIIVLHDDDLDASLSFSALLNYPSLLHPEPSCCFSDASLEGFR